MLREIKNGDFAKHNLTLLGWRWRFVHGKRRSSASWSTGTVRALLGAQVGEPVAFMADGARVFWAFEGRYFWEDEGLQARDVVALVRERDRRAERKLKHAHAALAHEELEPQARRERIPRDVRQHVFERDGGRCADCGADFDLQFDHVIPFSMGGASSAENLQLLCAPCNRAKGASLA